MPNTVKVKPGYKTTEFWVAFVTSIATLANQSGLLGDFQLPVEAIATIGGIVAAYIVGRAVTKNGAAKNATSVE